MQKLNAPQCPHCKREWNNADVCDLYTRGECNGCGRYVSGGVVGKILREFDEQNDGPVKRP